MVFLQIPDHNHWGDHSHSQHDLCKVTKQSDELHWWLGGISPWCFTVNCFLWYSTSRKVLEQKTRLDTEIFLHLDASGRLFFCAQTHVDGRRRMHADERRRKQNFSAAFFVQAVICLGLESLSPPILTPKNSPFPTLYSGMHQLQPLIIKCYTYLYLWYTKVQK